MVSLEKIQQIKNNLFYRAQDAIENYHTFNWHCYKKQIDTDKVNSSQALAIDFWGCLKLSKFKDELINMLFCKDAINWKIDFEYIDPKLLSEHTSTQVDVLLHCKTNAIIIESKFTERDGGACSQVNLYKGVKQCNGNYEPQTNPYNNRTSSCALTGKGVGYWNFIEKITDFKSTERYSPCPFKKGEYQWMRNIAFASAYSTTYNVAVESYLVFLDSVKCSIARKVRGNSYLGALKGKVKDTVSFTPLSYNLMVTKCINFLEIDSAEKMVWEDLRDWMGFKEKNLK
jgi:hypothetical protein